MFCTIRGSICTSGPADSAYTGTRSIPLVPARPQGGADAGVRHEEDSGRERGGNRRRREDRAERASHGYLAEGVEWIGGPAGASGNTANRSSRVTPDGGRMRGVRTQARG